MTPEPTGTSAPSAPSIPGEVSGAPAASSGDQSVSLPAGGEVGAPPSSAPAPAPEPWEGLPKSWKKEMESHWGGLTPEARRYIHEREQQAYRGIQQYSRGHENWTKLTQPLESVLQQFPETDPVELFQTLMQHHLTLMNGTLAEKQALATQMLQHYGVQLGEASSGGAGQPFSAEQLAYLQQTLAPVLKQVQTTSAFAQQAQLTEAQKSVDKFFSDPQNEFVEDVGQDMLETLRKGQAQSLAEAYELAVLRNPEVKAKYIARLASGAALAQAPRTNVKSSTTPAAQGKPATMEESFAAVLKKHYG